MRQLHLVGVTDDRMGLILADDTEAVADRCILPVDESLLEVLRQLRRARPRGPAVDVVTGPGPSGQDRSGDGHRPTFPESRSSAATLTPRQIQARLRAGRSVTEVAREAGADEGWIERFAPPIRAERAAAVTRAGQLVFRTPRRGPSARPLGESVRRNLLEKGVRLAEADLAARWSAVRHEGREWVIRFTYQYRGRDVEADWLADLRAGSLVALNRPAASLGFVAPAPPSAPVQGTIDLTGPAAIRPASGRGGAGHLAGDPSADLPTSS